MAFRPEQIKSATENNGDFSRENPDIRYRDGESEPRDFGAELRELMYRRLRGEDVDAELEQLRADREAARRAAESAEVRTENGGAGSGEVPFRDGEEREGGIKSVKYRKSWKKRQKRRTFAGKNTKIIYKKRWNQRRRP